MKWKVESGKWKTGGGKRITFHFPLSVLLFLVLLFSSCHVRKKLVSPMAHAADYEWMTAKMTFDVSAEGMELNDLSGVLRMRRDSVIWISASAFMGMEAVRACVTCDSVVVVNRLDKTYLAEPLAEAAEKLSLPLTLQETQALLLGDGRSDRVALQFGPYTAKIRYADIHWDEPTTFPIPIGKTYERRTL